MSKKILRRESISSFCWQRQSQTSNFVFGKKIARLAQCVLSRLLLLQFVTTGSNFYNLGFNAIFRLLITYFLLLKLSVNQKIQTRRPMDWQLISSRWVLITYEDYGGPRSVRYYFLNLKQKTTRCRDATRLTLHHELLIGLARSFNNSSTHCEYQNVLLRMLSQFLDARTL